MAVFDRKGKTNDGRAPVDQVAAGILGDRGLDVPGLNWSSIGGSGKGMKASDMLAQQKFLYDVGQDRNAAAQTQVKGQRPL